jgi:hypothetical protein
MFMSDLHSALRTLLYEQGNVRRDEVGIQFETPTKEWLSSLLEPTVNLFLFAVQENIEKRETNMQTVRSASGVERRLPPRRMDLHYMVSVAATEVEDEHALLWRILAALMKHQQFPPERLSESLSRLDPPLSSRVGDKEESSRLLEIWNALGSPPRPAVCYIVTAPLDLEVVVQAPLVLTRSARYRSTASGKVHTTRIHIGGVVRDKQGRPLPGITVRMEHSAGEGSTTNEEGRFVLRGVPAGRVGLHVSDDGVLKKRVELVVPAECYEIVLDK